MLAIITMNTTLNCIVPIDVEPVGGARVVRCGTDVHVGCTIMYCCHELNGGSYAIYDSNGTCIREHIFGGDDDILGGGFTVDASMSYVKFSGNVEISKTATVTVTQIINQASDLVELQRLLSAYCVDTQYMQDIINLYLDNKATLGLNVYPVGAIYLSSIDVDPFKLFGGAWQRLFNVFDASIYAYVRVEESITPIADMAVADKAICA